MNVDASNDDKAFENTKLGHVVTETNTIDLDNPYGLDHMFNNDELPMEDKHVIETPSSPQGHSRSHIDIIWDPSRPTSELGANEPYDSDTQICTFDISLFNIDDDMPLVHPDLMDWDQKGPLTFD